MSGSRPIPTLGGGIVDTFGRQTTRDVSELALFEIPEGGEWQPGDPTKGEPENMPKMEGCRYVHYFRETKEYKPNPQPRPVTLWHSRGMGYDDTERTALKTWFEANETWTARYGPRDWILARFDRQAGRWEIIDYPLDRLLVELIEDLQTGLTATAKIILYDGATWTASDVEIEVHVPQKGAESKTIAAGSWVYARRVASGPEFGDPVRRSRWEVESTVGVTGVRLAMTDSSGIASGASATVTEKNVDGTDYEEEGAPVTYEATNIAGGAVGANRLIMTLPWRRDTSVEIVVWEDCPEEA